MQTFAQTSTCGCGAPGSCSLSAAPRADEAPLISTKRPHLRSFARRLTRWPTCRPAPSEPRWATCLLLRCRAAAWALSRRGPGPRWQHSSQVHPWQAAGASQAASPVAVVAAAQSPRPRAERRSRAPAPAPVAKEREASRLPGGYAAGP
jgi:hypothetical protein